MDGHAYDILGDEELAVVVGMEKSCRSKRNRLKEICVLQKLSQHLANRQVLLDDALNAIKNDNAYLSAQIQLNGERDAARQMVDSVFKRLFVQGLKILGAVETAAMNYDLILQSKASKGLLGDIIINLIITFLPELKVLEKTFGLLVGVKLSGKEMISESTLKVITKSFAAVQTVGQRLDDVVNSIRGPINASGEMDAESQARYAAYAAKNRIFSQILGQLYAALDVAIVMEAFLQAMIITHPVQGVQSIVENVLRRTGLDEISRAAIKFEDTNQNTYSLLSNIILYDMLRAYVSNYVVVPGMAATASAVKLLPQYNDNIEGLDGSQRQMIYDRFSKVSWRDTRRPPINSYKDLILKWNAGISTFGRVTKVSG